MLFDLKPKENRRELYNRDEELRELHRLTKTEWVVILGRRMTGKTSLLKTFLKEVGGVYINLSGVRSLKGLIEELEKHARKIGLEVSTGLVKISWSRLAEDLFASLDGKIVGLDEAQELPANYALKLFKKIWDTYNIRLVFTGSMIGLLSRLLAPNPSNPLYGRQPATITLKPFTRQQSIKFLEKGFNECKINISYIEIEEAVETLNGYPGWLTYYGNMRCVRKLDHKKALEQVYNEGKQILRKELEKFLDTKRNKQTYIRLLRLLPARWSELLKALNINSKILRDMLKSLEGAMIIEKKGETYTIPDPIMRKLVYEL